MNLVAFRQEFDPIHLIEAPRSTHVRISGIDALELPIEAERTLYDALMTANWVFYSTDISSRAILSHLATNPLIGKATLQTIDAWLEKHSCRWIGLI